MVDTVTVPRSFPFRPTSTSQLEVGDVVPVRRPAGTWGALQVIDLKRDGAGARTSLIIGVLPWDTAAPPTAEDVAGLAVTEQGLTDVDLFRQGGLQVVANTPPVPTSLGNAFRDANTGAVNSVWGWRAALRKAIEPAT